MRFTLKTKWLLPLMVIALAVLVVDLPTSASDQVALEDSIATEELDLTNEEASQPETREFDSTTHGTY
jgi:hypothetical protein